MAGRLSDEICALCGAFQSTRHGEHVLPDWLMEDLFPPSAGPYTTHRNGQPVAKRDGAPREFDSLPRLLLPACNPESGGRCNGILDKRFETDTARAGVRKMFASEILDEGEATAAGLWWLKTVLLSKHPAARSTDPGPDRPVWRDDVDPALYSWLIDGSAPPEYTTVWVSRGGDERRGDSSLVDRLNLPTIQHGALTYRSHSAVFGVGDLLLSLLVHPAWVPEHPLEATGRAIRIFPWAGGPFDSGELRVLDDVDAGVWNHTFGYDVRLMVDPDHDLFATPLTLGPGWDRDWGRDLPGVIGFGG